MPQEPLPSAGSERDIFLIALKHFSDKCSMPDLIADCPFSVDLPGGGRGCGEECEDLLSRHGRPTSNRTFLSETAGLAVERKPAVDEGPQYPEGSRPFDAREIFRRSMEMEQLEGWHSVALLATMQELASTPPAERTPQLADRRQDIIDELERRRYQVVDLVRHGLADRISQEIVSRVATRIVTSVRSAKKQPDEIHDGEQEFDLLIKRWLDLCKACRSNETAEIPAPKLNIRTKGSDNVIELLPPDAGQLLLYCVSTFQELVARWLANTEIEKIMAWTPPTIDTLTAHRANVVGAPADPVNRANRREAEWIWDRFTNTYMEDWSAESLKLEWRYQRGKLVRPLPKREMMLRPINRVRLSELAADAEVSIAGRTVQSRQLVTAALDLLFRGQRIAAAALFSATLLSDWQNGETYNNYGFCVLPDNPIAAHEALKKAANLGFTPTVNSANQALALYWQGKHAAALEVVAPVISNWGEQTLIPAFLWNFDAPRDLPQLLSRACPRCYVAVLATRIAESSGDGILISRWRRATGKVIVEHDGRCAEIGQV